MNQVLQQLRPQQAFSSEDGGDVVSRDAAGYGNLSRTGAIESMNVPRVLDVSQLNVRHQTTISADSG